MLILACAAPPTVEVLATPQGVRVEADAPVSAAEVRDAEGVPVARARPAAASPTLEITAPLSAGEYTVVATIAGSPVERPLTVFPREPVRVEVQPGPGADWLDARGNVDIPVIDGGAVDVVVSVTPGPGHPASVPWQELLLVQDPDVPWALQLETLPLGVEGARVIRTVRVGDAPVRLTVGDTSFALVPRPVSIEALRDTLVVGEPAFPAEADGSPDLGRPQGRVALPSPAWERLVRSIGLGGRRRDPDAPWAALGVPLENKGDTPLDLELSLEVREDGQPSSWFRPRQRAADAATGTVSAILRVPAHGTAQAALPVFVDAAAVPDGAYTRTLTIRPLGGESPIHVLEAPLYVTRGDVVASAGFLASVLAALGGGALVLTRLRRWLDTAATSELMTIALFGSALFVVGTAADLLVMGVGAVFGPVSTLFTGLVNDLGRYALLATLLTLLPRPGTLALAILTGWFLRGFSTGAFAPVDLLWTASAVGWSEAFAWMTGLTRGPDWRDRPGAWVRLALGFAGASVATTLSGLWMHVVLYRLFFAPWYVLVQVLGPGGLYVVFATRLGSRLAASLRRVDA